MDHFTPHFFLPHLLLHFLEAEMSCYVLKIRSDGNISMADLLKIEIALETVFILLHKIL